jgi:phosphate acetyltransferase
MIHNLVNEIKEKAKANPKRIVFPEGDEDRVLQAVNEIKKEGTAIPVILGDVDKIKWRAGELKLDINDVEMINPEHSDKLKGYAKEFFNLRKKKGMTEEKAIETMKDVSYFGTMMVHMNDADGLVSGTTHSTADTIRPALQIIKTAPGHSLASSFFIMIFEDKTYKLFADCGFVMDPNAEELSEIAISTADSAKKFGLDPKIAMLSFSTHGSASNPSVDKVREATELVRKKRPDLVVDGEIQLDAAIIPSIAAKKCPDCVLKGEANILIFPDLNSGNIGYKLTERLAHAMAIGPIVQGLNKPVNDLSRGCAVHDIVEVTAITVVEAQEK